MKIQIEVKKVTAEYLALHEKRFELSDGEGNVVLEYSHVIPQGLYVQIGGETYVIDEVKIAHAVIKAVKQ